MNLLFRHFLLIGAIFGLLWHGVAYASPPCADMQHGQSVAAASMAGMADCMDSEKQAGDEGLPCKDMQAGCFAMVGCASLVALDASFLSISAPNNGASSFSLASSPVLLGRNEAPIPDPPSIPG